MTIATPATLYWASGVSEDAFGRLWCKRRGLDWGGAWEYDPDTDPTFPQTKLAEIEGQALFAAANADPSPECRTA